MRSYRPGETVCQTLNGKVKSARAPGHQNTKTLRIPHAIGTSIPENTYYLQSVRISGALVVTYSLLLMNEGKCAKVADCFKHELMHINKRKSGRPRLSSPMVN